VRTALRAAAPALPRRLHAFWLHSGALGAALAHHRPLSARAHGGDLYAYRHDGYLPLHDFTQARLDALLLVSDHAAAYLQARSAAAKKRHSRPAPIAKSRPQVVRLGTPAAQRLAMPGTDGCLHVLSVGRAVPLKRLPLLARAVGLCDLPVVWTHLGSGPQLALCEHLTRSYKPAQQARFFGYLAPAALRAYYETEAVDLCVSVSSCEGLPVSLMEALAHGVPTLATAAGGSPEALLDPELCLPLHTDAPTVAAALQHFAHRPKEARQRLRERAVALWAQRFAAAAQGHRLTEALGACSA
jgi:colanic acid/amylovoran biosynthesis glycosyltransferase